MESKKAFSITKNDWALVFALEVKIPVSQNLGLLPLNHLFQECHMEKINIYLVFLTLYNNYEFKFNIDLCYSLVFSATLRSRILLQTYTNIFSCILTQ